MGKIRIMIPDEHLGTTYRWMWNSFIKELYRDKSGRLISFHSGVCVGDVIYTKKTQMILKVTDILNKDGRGTIRGYDLTSVEPSISDNDIYFELFNELIFIIDEI